jgi:DNA polymerase family B
VTSPRFVYRDKGRINKLQFGTFDLETFGLGGVYADGATFDGEVTTRHRDLDSLFSELMNPPRDNRRCFTWVAHAGSRYDFTYIAVRLRDLAVQNSLQIETVQQGTKIIALIIPSKAGKIKLIDSYPFLDASLEDASRAYAPGQMKLGHCESHDFTKLNSTPADWYSPDCPVCVEYLTGDVVSLWHTYANARSMTIKHFGIEPGLTAGSTAMRAWKSMIPAGHVYYRQAPEKERFARHFTTGAFTYPGYSSDPMAPAITVDRSAAFAACQYEGGYPVSAGVWEAEYTDDYFGLWECEAYCPEGTFPLVPLTKDGIKLWATGSGTAYVTSEQYRLCLDNGYTLNVVRGLSFEKLEDVFTKFISVCENFEYPPDGSAADPAIKALAKRMRNSLNGKFNIRPDMERLYIGEPVEGSTPVIDPETGLDLPLYSMNEETDAPYAQPVWYAITVARQQIEEHRLRLLMPPEQTGKFDTDSATSVPEVIMPLIESGAIDIGPGYGKYKIEHEWAELVSLGPKNYLGTESDGTQIDYCKGIPRRVIKAHRDDHRRAANCEKIEIQFESMRSMNEMLASNHDTPGITRLRSISTPLSVLGWAWDEKTHIFTPMHRP